MNEEINQVIDIVCRVMGVDKQEVLTRKDRRRDRVYYARLIIAEELHRAWRFPLQEIGNLPLFNKTHPTVINMHKAYDANLHYKDFRERAELIKWEVDLIRNTLPC